MKSKADTKKAAEADSSKSKTASESKEESKPDAPALAIASQPTSHPAAVRMIERETITGQVFEGDHWREAEVFVVEPGRNVLMGIALPEGFAAAEIDEISPDALPPGDRVFTVNLVHDYHWSVPVGIPVRVDQHRFEWVAPAVAGPYAIRCEVSAKGSIGYQTGKSSVESRNVRPAAASISFLFLVPYRLDSRTSAVIQGYPIGTYPDETASNIRSSVARNREHYRPPEYFVPVTSATAKLRVSEHFRLGELVTIPPGRMPVYFPYNPRLVAALEAIHDRLEEAGFREPRIRILRSFLSPHQVRELEAMGISLLTWNRYQYGDGVIFIVDSDRNNRLDDMNRDGELDMEDARALARLVAEVQKKNDLRGWVGVYSKDPGATLPNTPMVGFDVRGWQIEMIEADSSESE